LHSAARCLAGASQQATKLSPAWGPGRGFKNRRRWARLQLENLFFGYLKKRRTSPGKLSHGSSLVE
jgi:hypothetical protein